MLRFANKNWLGAPALMCAAGILMACGIADVSTLDLSMNPSIDLTVLGEGEEVWVDFGRDVDRPRAERCVAVRDGSGSISFDVSWSGSRMTVLPAEAWSPGIRYELVCDGTVYAEDGRSFPVRKSVRFFQQSSSPGPDLVSWSPPDDAIVGNAEPIALRFSGKVDGAMLERHISVSPSRDLLFGIVDDGCTIIVSPVDGWVGMTRYRWSVADTLTDVEGKSLGSSGTGTFRTYTDNKPAGQPAVFAVETSDAATRYPIASMARGMGILLSFPEPIDTGTLRRRFTIEPVVDVAFRDINSSEVMVFPDGDDWMPGGEYSATIMEGVEDRAGNATTESFSFGFPVAIPVIEVVSIANVPPLAHEPFIGEDLSSGDPLSIGIDISMKSHTFTIVLSESFTPVEAERLVKSISVHSFFPDDAGNPMLSSILPVYEKQNSITLDFTGFLNPGSNPEERYLYKLSIAGGEQGFSLDNGARLSEDFELLLETTPY